MPSTTASELNQRMKKIDETLTFVNLIKDFIENIENLDKDVKNNFYFWYNLIMDFF